MGSLSIANIIASILALVLLVKHPFDAISLCYIYFLGLFFYNSIAWKAMTWKFSKPFKNTGIKK